MLDIPGSRKTSSNSVASSSIAGSRNSSRVGSICGSAGLEDTSPTIKVCVRVRPFIKEEYLRDGGNPVRCVNMLSRRKVEITRPGPDNMDASLAAVGVRDETNIRTFEFDRSYWSFNNVDQPFATQATIFQELGETLLNHAISGFNNCIFAYGQTASGKSHSVLGSVHDDEERGLLPRIVEGLFEHFSQLASGTTCKCLVSFIEIYNEQIRDLLTPTGYSPSDKRKSTGGDRKLEVRQHAVLGTYIPGLVECAAGSCKEVLDLIDYGTTIRSVGETAMNQCSSRSHCIFTFKTTVVEPSGQARMSQTHLVDLAGSERTKRTGATGDRLKEGVAINRSLSTLARVISALASGDGQPPFRESRLTYILKESLCGNSKTVMMAAISPSAADYDETLSTLKFAQSVKKVQTHAVVNEVNEKGIEAQLREELRLLREQLEQCEAQKNNDAQQLSAAQRRLQEQEDLCSRFGSGWDTALAAERRRREQRRAVTQSDLGHLQETFQRMHRESILRRQEELAARGKEASSDSSSDEEEWDGIASDSSDDSTSKKAEAVLVCMTGGAGAEEPELIPQSLQRGTKKLSVTGRATLGLGGLAATPERAQQVQEALKQLRVIAEEAEKLANALTPPSALRVRLRPMVVVDPTAARGATIAVAVAPHCDYDDLLDPSSTQDEDSLLEWISDEQLRRRLAWLKDAAAATASAQREKFSRVGAWTAAAAAISAEMYGLSESRGSRPGHNEEVARLRSELAAAKLEATQAVGELAETRGQLEDARRELAIRPLSTHLDKFAPRARTGTPPKQLADDVVISPDAPGTIAAEIAASFRNALGALDQAQAALNGGARPGTRVIRRQK